MADAHDHAPSLADDGGRRWVDDVLRFWFEELGPKDWFQKSDDLDARITQRFQPLHSEITSAETDAFLGTPREAFAALIVLDQFSRNIYRDTPQAFASDAKALALANAMVARGYDQALPVSQRVFAYLPFEHSEDMDDQDRSVALIQALGDDEFIKYAEAHRDVIARYGRFPHRNAILGRPSTAAELDYLAQPGSGF